MQAVRILATLVAALLPTEAIANKDQSARFTISPIPAEKTGELQTVGDIVTKIVADDVGVCKDIVYVQRNSVADKFIMTVTVKATEAKSKVDIQNVFNSKLIDGGDMNNKIVAEVQTTLGITGVTITDIEKMDGTFGGPGSCPASGSGAGGSSVDTTSGTTAASLQMGFLTAAAAAFVL